MLRSETKTRVNRVFDEVAGREVASLLSFEFKVNYLLDELEGMKQLIQDEVMRRRELLQDHPTVPG